MGRSPSVPAEFEEGGLAGDTHPQREAVEARAPVNVEMVRSLGEMTVIGPARVCQHGPVEAEAHEAHLTAVGVTRENQVHRIVGQIVERAGIVEQQQSAVALQARVCGEQVLQMLASIAADVVSSDDLHRPSLGVDRARLVHQEPDAVGLEARADFIRGLVVVIAEDGEQAVEKASSEAFDLILMDVQMPKMNGYAEAL